VTVIVGGSGSVNIGIVTSPVSQDIHRLSDDVVSDNG
jgi:hypothetical protein